MWFGVGAILVIMIMVPDYRLSEKHAMNMVSCTLLVAVLVGGEMAGGADVGWLARKISAAGWRRLHHTLSCRYSPCSRRRLLADSSLSPNERFAA